MDEEDFRLSVISRPKSKVFHGIRRLPVLRQETPTEELIASRPHHPHHPLEQSVIYECHVRGMANSPSISVSGFSQSGTYQGLVECIPNLKALGVTAIELLPVFDFDENEKIVSDAEIEHTVLNCWVTHRFFFCTKTKLCFRCGKSSSRI